MAILQKLHDLGFESEHLGTDKSKIETWKIRTSRGWTYQRFKFEEEVDAWANFHKPEDK